jgi:hypothetical protein
MIDLSGKDYHASASAFTGKSFDPNHIASAMTMNGKPYFTLNEKGASTTSETVDGDINPKWLALTTTAQDYKSTVEFVPQIRTSGALLHFYKKCENYFMNVQSAILECRSRVDILETVLGGAIAANSTIASYKEAMNNSEWKYGKIGSENKKIGLDNIQLQIGMFANQNKAETDRVLAIALAVEIPTGKGTTAEYVFEPRVGGNHFGLGIGFDDYYKNETSQIVFGVHYRYLFSATETRSFDLLDKPWSRYIRVISIPTSTTSSGVEAHGINALTLQAQVTPGHQLNSYVRWAEQWNKINFELGYNFFFKVKERISAVQNFASEFGIKNLLTLGSTINKAAMNANFLNTTFITSLVQDPGVAITQNDLDLDSAAVGLQAISSISARLEYVGDLAQYGIGGSVEGAHSKHAYASWNLWINAGVQF